MIPNLSKNVFLLGVGGIGMSALAKFLLHQGHHVAGYDRTPSILTQELIKEGVFIYYTFDEYHLLSRDWTVIYTPAVPSDHPVFNQAKFLQIPLLKRSEVLGIISEDYVVIAVAGTHGKTSVTAMITHLLTETGLKPTAFIGGVAKNFNSNLVEGTSQFLVVEADEYDRSFLTLTPSIAVLTALDPDHLDIYGTENYMIDSYKTFLDRVKPNGTILMSNDIKADFHLKENIKLKTYGGGTSHFRYDRMMTDDMQMKFDYSSDINIITDIKLQIAGEHNVSNMTAAIAVAEILGAEKESIKKAVASYSGIKRRFDIVLHNEEITLIDDYAHHPKEISVTINAVRQLLPNRQLIVVFQPHLFTRTRDFYLEFAESLSKADVIVLTHIYPAREQPLPNVTCETIYNALGNMKPKYVLNLNQIKKTLHELVESPTVVLIMGAGDIDSVVQPLRQVLNDLYS